MFSSLLRSLELDTRVHCLSLSHGRPAGPPADSHLCSGGGGDDDDDDDDNDGGGDDGDDDGDGGGSDGDATAMRTV